MQATDTSFNSKMVLPYLKKLRCPEFLAAFVPHARNMQYYLACYRKELAHNKGPIDPKCLAVDFFVNYFLPHVVDSHNTAILEALPLAVSPAGRRSFTGLVLWAETLFLVNSGFVENLQEFQQKLNELHCVGKPCKLDETAQGAILLSDWRRFGAEFFRAMYNIGMCYKKYSSLKKSLQKMLDLLDSVPTSPRPTYLINGASSLQPPSPNSLNPDNLENQGIESRPSQSTPAAR